MNALQELMLKLGGQAVAGSGAPIGGMTRKTHYKIECVGKDGKLKWVEEFDNLVVTEGLNDSLDKHLKGSTYTAAWYIGLTAGSPSPAAGDTMSSHAGWTEVVAYSQANRVAVTFGSVSGGSVDNSGSPASFSINADTTTIGGAFLVTNNTKSGTTGILYGVGAFSAGNKVLDNGDTLNVTITCSASAS